MADGRAAPIARSAAAAYLASFLARAAFVPDTVLIHSLERLARWCLAYCHEQVRPAGPWRSTPTAHLCVKWPQCFTHNFMHLHSLGRGFDATRRACGQAVSESYARPGLWQ